MAVSPDLLRGIELRPNKALQLTRAARGALQDRRHFEGFPDVSNPYSGAGN